MKKIQLSRGKFALVDDNDFPELSKYRWHALKTANTYYAVRHMPRADGKRPVELMHRVITGAQKGQVVDHKNGDGLDNRQANVRICSWSENMRNSKMHRNNTSGYRGVYWDRNRGKWRAGVKVDGKTLHSGSFENVEDAARASDVVAREHHGDFARTNF